MLLVIYHANLNLVNNTFLVLNGVAFKNPRNPHLLSRMYSRATKCMVSQRDHVNKENAIDVTRIKKIPMLYKCSKILFIGKIFLRFNEKI